VCAHSVGSRWSLRQVRGTRPSCGHKKWRLRRSRHGIKGEIRIGCTGRFMKYVAARSRGGDCQTVKPHRREQKHLSFAGSRGRWSARKLCRKIVQASCACTLKREARSRRNESGLPFFVRCSKISPFADSCERSAKRKVEKLLGGERDESDDGSDAPQECAKPRKRTTRRK